MWRTYRNFTRASILNRKVKVMTHELKAWPEYFEPMLNGRKSFDARRNDRDFQEGDWLLIREFIPEGEGEYTGREFITRVTYVLEASPLYGLQEGFVILGISLPK